MLTELCAEIRNYFVVPGGIHIGTFKISGGTITPLDFLQDGQYFRIVGSTFNDGVYRYPDDVLIDEEFNGAVWAMAVPPTVIALAAEIDEWAKSDAAKATAFESESFGGYSYTRATDKNGAPLTWQTVFARRLTPYRRMNVL